MCKEPWASCCRAASSARQFECFGSSEQGRADEKPGPALFVQVASVALAESKRASIFASYRCRLLASRSAAHTTRTSGCPDHRHRQAPSSSFQTNPTSREIEPPRLPTGSAPLLPQRLGCKRLNPADKRHRRWCIRQTKLTQTKRQASPSERPAAAAEACPAVVAPHRAMATTSSRVRPLHRDQRQGAGLRSGDSIGRKPNPPAVVQRPRGILFPPEGECCHPGGTALADWHRPDCQANCHRDIEQTFEAFLAAD